MKKLLVLLLLVCSGSFAQEPQVTFGPVGSITQFTDAALAQDEFRWEITFTLNTVAGIQGLASRDESGQDDSGHLSVWIDNGELIVRHQDIEEGQETQRLQVAGIVAATEYVAVVSIEQGVGMQLLLDGQLIDSTTIAFGIAGNDLPLTLGGRCWGCNDVTGPTDEIDGTVSLAIYNDPIVVGIELPYFERAWVEGSGAVALSATDLEHFGQSRGRVEVDFMPRLLYTEGDSLRILDIPNHLGIWVYDDGIHGNWYTEAGEERLFRARWGLLENGVEVKIVITWDEEGYAVIVNDIVRIHDWQTTPTTVYPDPDIVDGVYGARMDGSQPANGAFRLRVYDKSRTYDGCAVDVVGTINQNTPRDNSGNWAEGIDPKCSETPVSTENPPTLNWELPIQNEDGSTITNLAGVRIFRQVHDTFDPTVTSWTGDWLPPGEYRYVSTAYTYHVPADPMANPPVVEILAAESVFSNDVFTVVGPLVATATPVYTIFRREDGIRFSEVGSVSLGTPCNAEETVNGRYMVSKEFVTWIQEGTEIVIVYADCG